MTTGTDLRDRLMAAYHGGDRQTFIELCQRHAATIVRHFTEWAVAPVEIRHDQQAVGDYVQALASIATVLDALGHHEPMQRLNPAGPANPINRWIYAYQRAQQLKEAGEYAASSVELHTLLTDMHGTVGPGVEEIRTKVAGLLGSNALRLGRVDEAVHHTEEALRRCQVADDREGVWIYTENLETVLVVKEVTHNTTAGRELTHARERLAFAQDLSDARRYPASNEVLHELLDVVPGTAAARYLGKIYGLLGLNHFRLNDLPAAEHFTERALTDCHERHDHMGEQIYAANLSEIRRH